MWPHHVSSWETGGLDICSGVVDDSFKSFWSARRSWGLGGAFNVSLLRLPSNSLESISRKRLVLPLVNIDSIEENRAVRLAGNRDHRRALSRRTRALLRREKERYVVGLDKDVKCHSKHCFSFFFKHYGLLTHTWIFREPHGMGIGTK